MEIEFEGIAIKILDDSNERKLNKTTSYFVKINTNFIFFNNYDISSNLTIKHFLHEFITKPFAI